MTIDEAPINQKVKITLSGSVINYEGTIEYSNTIYIIFKHTDGRIVSIPKQLIENVEKL